MNVTAGAGGIRRADIGLGRLLRGSRWRITSVREWTPVRQHNPSASQHWGGLTPTCASQDS